MLRFDQVDFTYKGDTNPMIKGLSFEVEAGDFVSIIGASGCGKTTLFRLLNGLEHIQAGKITVDGENIQTLKNYSAYMPQRDMLLPWKNVEQNVCLPMQVQKVSKKEQKEAAKAMLERVGLSDYANKYPRELSGGMRQRVAFARTLCGGGNLLLLDEPFSALDYITRIDLQEWLMQQYEKLEKTVLFITHDVEEAIFLSKKIYVITERPVTQIEVYDVDLPYPRNREMLGRHEIQALKEKLIRKLR